MSQNFDPLDDFLAPASTTIEVVVEPQSAQLTHELATVVQKSGLELQSAREIEAAFAPLFANAQKWVSMVDAIHVTDASQTQEMALARETRLELKKVRVEAKKTHKRLKDSSLKRGKAIDGVYNILEYIVAPLEARLQEQEEFAERAEAGRRAALKAEREAQLAPYGVDTTCYDIGMMTCEVFDQLLTTAKNVAAERAETARRIEAQRVAREKAEADERERVRLENVRLKAEAAEREKMAAMERAEAARLAKVAKDKADAVLAAVKQEADDKAKALKAENDAREAAAQAERLRLQALADAERAKTEAAAKLEREARQKAEDELRRREAQEAAAIAAKVQAQQKAARAPDKEKVISFAASVRALTLPAAETVEGKQTMAEIEFRIKELALWIDAKGGAL